MNNSARRRAAWATASGAAALVLLTATGAHAEGRGDIRVVGTVVNGGKPVGVGTVRTITFPVVLTVRDDSGVKGVSHVSTMNVSNAYGFIEWAGTSCTKKSATTSVCTATMTATPAWMPASDDIDTNRVAGLWQVNATVQANDGDYWIAQNLARYSVKRATTLTADAAPEPVRRGGRLTVTGTLGRADWETLKYRGYAGQQVQLQFRKAGTTRYTTVKTVLTGSAGRLSTTVTASAAGDWRWYYPGSPTTMVAVSPGDTVTVK